MCFVIWVVILLDLPNQVSAFNSCIVVFFFINESLPFFHIVIKRNFIKNNTRNAPGDYYHFVIRIAC